MDRHWNIKYYKENIESALGERTPTKNPTQDTNTLNDGSLGMSKLPPIRRFPGSSIVTGTLNIY
jgi:hypothetical protein